MKSYTGEATEAHITVAVVHGVFSSQHNKQKTYILFPFFVSHNGMVFVRNHSKLNFLRKFPICKFPEQDLNKIITKLQKKKILSKSNGCII